MSNPFASDRYYVLLSTVASTANLTLSLGLQRDPPLTPHFDTLGSYSSENWQIFYDEGVYFLRNYDWGDKYQLGLDNGDQTMPQMRTSAATLGMQWNITSGSTSGTYILRNALLGASNVLTVSTEDNGTIVPVMNTDQRQASWILSKNLNAAVVTNTAMLASYTSIETATTTTTTSSTTSVSSATSANSSVASNSSTQSSSISGGAIAGIVIGVIAGIVLLLVLTFVYLRRHRRRQQQHQRKVNNDIQLGGGTTAQPLMQEYTAELHSDDRKLELAGYPSAKTNVVSELPVNER